jgi:Flp pilus assembly pilin Flp
MANSRAKSATDGERSLPNYSAIVKGKPVRSIASLLPDVFCVTILPALPAALRDGKSPNFLKLQWSERRVSTKILHNLTFFINIANQLKFKMIVRFFRIFSIQKEKVDDYSLDSGRGGDRVRQANARLLGGRGGATAIELGLIAALIAVAIVSGLQMVGPIITGN